VCTLRRCLTRAATPATPLGRAPRTQRDTTTAVRDTTTATIAASAAPSGAPLAERHGEGDTVRDTQ
jgi:hypothetical protein